MVLGAARVCVITSAAPERAHMDASAGSARPETSLSMAAPASRAASRGAGAPRVHRHGDAGVGQAPHQRDDPLGLLGLGHRGPVGAAGLPAHVDDVGALVDQGEGALGQLARVLRALAVRERVGGRVDDAHDQRRPLRRSRRRAGGGPASCRLGDGLAGHQALQGGHPPPLLQLGLGHSRWVGVGIGVGALAGLIAAGVWLLNPLFRALAAAKAREVMTAAALLVVLGAALLMQVGGLSMAMGAFLAGVLLSESTFRHQLEADIEPFRGVLLGLFFLAVGMVLDLPVVVGEAGGSSPGCWR